MKKIITEAFMKSAVKSKSIVRPVDAKEKPTAAPQHERIAVIAFELYELDGRPEGKALEHWFNAEAMDESQFGEDRNHTERDLTKNSDIA